MESANPRIHVPWSELPPELIANIARRLPTAFDVCRLRAVCRSWHSSVPPCEFPTVSIKLPFPFPPHLDIRFHPMLRGSYFTLTERIVYLIQSPGDESPSFWLVKVERSGNGKMRIINPVTHRKIEISPAIETPLVLNILDVDVSEVCKAYALRYVNPSRPDESDDYYDYRFAKKVVFSSNVENGDYTVMAIDLNKNLWCIKSGCKKWTSIRFDDILGLFYDVALVKGQFHAIDSTGCVCAFDPMLGWKKTASISTNAWKLRMVELCDGELVLVEEMGKEAEGLMKHNFNVSEAVVDIGIYALTEQGKRYVDAKAMNGCIIVVSDDCSFSFPCQELKGARVFYTDRYNFVRDEDERLCRSDEFICYECDCRSYCTCLNGVETIADDDLVANDDVKRNFDGFYGHNIGVCDFETGNRGTALMFPELANMFWPPPTWLRRS